MIKKILLALVFFSLSTALLTGCGSKEKKQEKKEQIVTVKIVTPVQKLFFVGDLAPISVVPLQAPVDGQVMKVNFIYGSSVDKGETLFVINSATLAKNFRKTLSDYLQKKEAYANGVESFQGNAALYKAKVISRETYLNAESQYHNTILSFYQAKLDLEKILRQTKVDLKTIDKVSLSNIKAVNELLGRKFKNIELKAPASGIALFPSGSTGGGNDSSSSSGKSDKLKVGAEVKAGQTMLTIGDLKGFSMTVQVSEININRIKEGMPVVITGDAFPGITLKGKVTDVASQANPSQGSQGGLSMFNIKVSIATIPAQALRTIHVGMTAKAELEIKETPRMIIPINAVKQKNGKNVVTVVGKDGKRKAVSVQTGTTTATGVTINSGLKTGDKVVVND